MTRDVKPKMKSHIDKQFKGKTQGKEVCPLCKGKGYIISRFGYSYKLRSKARKMYAKGITLRKIGKEIGVDHPQKVKSLIVAKTI